ncbi:MAG: B12-binding domain-containing radical SAM protein [Promethearchaeota archaeon]
MSNKILFVQIYAGEGIGSEFLYRKPSEYREYLLNTFVEMKKWVNQDIFNQIKDWPDEVDIRYEAEDLNLSGRFLASNIDTPSKVLDQPVNPEILISELEKDSYTHIGFSIISNDYTNFVKCAQAVKKYNSSIITIAGNTGAMFEQTKNYVDYVCIGRGVPFLRNLFNEKIDKPYKLSIMPSQVRWKYLNLEIPYVFYRIVTKIGCPLQCDFCTTPKLYNGEYTGELFSPKYVHDALIEFREEVRKDKIIIYFEEPTSLYSLKWWYEFFDLFKEDYGDFGFVVYSIASVLNKLNFDRITKFAARLHVVNFGIESFNKNYNKNIKVNMKSLIHKLSDYGIITNPNYIIGFDFDTKESVWDDIKKLIELDADINTILHLHPHPMTEIWDQLSSQNRLLDLPPDFYFIHGFQPYLHPNFKPGFEDILPLLHNIYNYIEREIGDKALHVAQTMKKLLNHTNHPIFFKQEIKSLLSIGKQLYPRWKEFFKPNEAQDSNYLSHLERK